MKELYKVLKSILIVAVGLFAIDWCVGVIGRSAIDNLPDFGDKTAKDKYRLEKAESDIIVIGSSRAKGNYVVELLKDSINTYWGTDYSMYNAGGEGQGANYACCIAENMIARKAPKLIIWEIRNFELGGGDGDVSNALDYFNPYYSINPIVKEYIDRESLKEKIKVQSNMYCFNYKLLRFFLSARIVDKPNDGFENDDKVMILTGDFKPKPALVFDHFSKYAVENAERLIAQCKKHDIKLVMVTSPQYLGTDASALLYSFCESHHIPFIDMYTVDSLNSHPEWWHDPNHLNKKGAIEYNKMFFQQLRKYL